MKTAHHQVGARPDKLAGNGGGHARYQTNRKAPRRGAMAWDEELQRLKVQVTDLFGDEMDAAAAMDAATRRALDVVSRQTVAQGDNAKPVTMSVFHKALKAELRRLVQPH